MNDRPQLPAQGLLDQLRGRFERLCSDVADAVNAAPAGQVINASEEKVRDLGERQGKSYLPLGFRGVMVMSYLGNVAERSRRALYAFISSAGTRTFVA